MSAVQVSFTPEEFVALLKRLDHESEQAGIRRALQAVEAIGWIAEGDWHLFVRIQDAISALL